MKELRHEMKHWLAVVLLLVVGTTMAGAFEKTVNPDGTDIDGRLPVYGIYAGAYQRCEFVMEASLLEGLEGAKINQLTFFINSSSTDVYIGKTKVFLKEIDETEFTDRAYFGEKDATVVYEGELDATSNKLIVQFKNSYEYKGGNLLVGMYVQEKVLDGGTFRVYGKKTNKHTGLAGFSFSSFDLIDTPESKEFVNFLPTVIFDCDNAPHDITYNAHDGKVSMTFAGCEADNTAVVGTSITATATVTEGYALANVRVEKSAGVSDDDVTVTKNEDGTYSFKMPDHSVYVNSDLLRDISYKVDVTEPLRFATDEDITFELTDVIDEDNPVKLTQDDQYTVTFDKDPTTTGKYTATFTGIEENGYTGTLEKEFTVQKKHIAKVKAGYFGTYFFATGIETFAKPEDINLATVTAVNDGNVSIALLENSNGKVSAEFPFLIYNPTATEQEYELWEAIDDVPASKPDNAAQFKGTAAEGGKTFDATAMAASDHYVLQNRATESGYVPDFVYVKDNGTIKQHRCWIELPKAAGARILTVTMDGITGISEMKVATKAAGIYDMQGRRLEGMPTQRGLYVIDGKKVVVK